LFGVVTITFFLTRVVGGDPAYLIAGPFADKSVIQHIREQLGTNRSLLVQYGHYLRDVVHLDFGTSFVTANPVTHDLGDRLPATLELVILSLALSLILGILSGAVAARTRGRLGDRSVRAGSFALLSLPDFWVGLMLLYIFFFRLRLAPPPFGQLSPSD